MNTYNIRKYTSKQKNQWDGIVENSKNGNFLCLRDYMDYHSNRFLDQSVIIYVKEKPVAVFPCNAHDDRIVSHDGLTYGGLIYGKEVHATDVVSMFLLLAHYYKSNCYNRIIYKAVPRIFHKYPSDEDLYCLFRFGAKLIRRDLSSVIEIASRPKFSDSRKNTARRSYKTGAKIVEDIEIGKLHLLLTSVLSKFGKVPVHSEEDLRLLKARFPKYIRIFGVMLGDQLLAASIVFDLGHVAHTQYMASSEVGRTSGALDYLLIHLIDNTFSDKKYLSFGISTEQKGLFLNEGLIRQKEGFGGRGIVHDFYDWDLLNYSIY